MKPPPTPAKTDWLARYSQLMARLVPDATSTVILMLIVLVIAALATGNSLSATVDAWYRGLWMLLPFTMQMTLVLVLGSVLAATPFLRRIIAAISQRPRTTTQVIAASALTVAFVSYLNWGLALALGPLIAVHFASEAERKGIPVDFPFLLAINGGAGSVWQFGLSASGPLLVATSGHFLENSMGVVSLRATIWAPASLALVITFPLIVIAVGRWLMPRAPQPISQFPSALKLAEPIQASTDEAETHFSARVERHVVMPLILGAALLVWLYYHFRVKGASLDLNSLNTIFLTLCFVLHGNIQNFSRALQRAVVSCWPILVLYHLYAGVAGLIQFTTVGAAMTNVFAPISNRWTFPLITALVATVIAIIVPSSGGHG